jgi:hypothetical protein
MSQRFVCDSRHVPVRAFPWWVVLSAFGIVSAFAAVDGRLGWRSTFASALFAGWIAWIIACTRARPRPIAVIRDGHMIVAPRRSRVYGFSVLLFGPLAILSALGGAWPLTCASVLLGAFIATLGRQRIRLTEGGFEQVGALGRVVRVSWNDVRAIRADARTDQIRLIIGDSQSRYVIFPEGWDGVASFAAAVVSGIPEHVRQSAPEELAVIRAFASFAAPQSYQVTRDS